MKNFVYKKTPEEIARYVFKTAWFFIKNNKNFRLYSISIIFVSSIAYIIYSLEHPYNEAYGSFIDMFYWTSVSITSTGYGDICPKTPSGRFFTGILLLVGIGLVGVITAKITSFLVERQLKEGKGLKVLENLINHFIICGWREGMEEFLVETLKLNPEFTADRIVLVNIRNQNDIDALRNNPMLREINFVYGDFVEESALSRANIKKAERILVLADTSFTSSTQEVDSRTVMTIMNVDAMNKNIYSCAEVFDIKFKKHLQMSHCAEIILSREYSRMMLTTATSASGISHIVTELLNVDSSSRIMTVEFPDNFISKTFKEIKDYFENLDGTVVIGILENTGNIFLQKKKAMKDAQKTPDISKLVSNLHNIKTMVANKPVLNPNPNYVLKKNCKAIVIEPNFSVI